MNICRGRHFGGGGVIVPFETCISPNIISLLLGCNYGGGGILIGSQIIDVNYKIIMMWSQLLFNGFSKCCDDFLIIKRT